MQEVVQAQAGIRWQSWALLGAMLLGGFVMFFFTRSEVVPALLRWPVTGAWLAVTLGMGLKDFVVANGPSANTDSTPFDRWTISHTGAGVVLGVWYSPLWVVVLLTIIWEVFEWKVRGFGDKEIFLNRVVDVGVALVGWLVVATIVLAATGSPFPLLAPVSP
jgi:hypothetical protein